jgi:hypothetical protein
MLTEIQIKIYPKLARNNTNREEQPTFGRNSLLKDFGVFPHDNLTFKE